MGREISNAALLRSIVSDFLFVALAAFVVLEVEVERGRSGRVAVVSFVGEVVIVVVVLIVLEMSEEDEG